MPAVPGPKRPPRPPLPCAPPALHRKRPSMVALAQSHLLSCSPASPEAALWQHRLPAPAVALPVVLQVSLFPQHYNLTQLLLAWSHPLGQELMCGFSQRPRFQPCQLVLRKIRLGLLSPNARFPNDLFFHARARLLPCPTHNTDLTQPLPQWNAASFTKPWLCVGFILSPIPKPSTSPNPKPSLARFRTWPSYFSSFKPTLSPLLPSSSYLI